MAARKATKKKSEEQQPGHVYTNADEAPVYYSNGAEVSSSAFDFRIRFGRVIGVEDERLRVQEVANVYMSPQHMKSFLFLLAGRVNAYEQQFGAIPGDYDLEAIPKGE